MQGSARGKNKSVDHLNLQRSRVREWPIWSLIYAPLCAHCRRTIPASVVLFCDACWAELPRAEKTPSDRLPKHIDGLHAAFAYREGSVTREIVHSLKFEGAIELAPRMVEMMLRTIPIGFLNSDDVWVPVPLHWIRKGDRSFNQSQLLTRELCKRIGGTISEVLRRVRNTPAQSGQGIRKRTKNVRGAFRYVRSKAIPESVMLVDDVVTTGATVSECARVLKQSGVKQVRVLTFARAE